MTKLQMVKSVHTAIYLIMVAAVLYLLFAGLTKTRGLILNISIILLATESVIFAVSGFKCPLTSLAKKYGDPKGYVGDTFLPEKWTKYTFRVFGSLFLIGILLLIFNK